jgi:hypothetical protein
VIPRDAIVLPGIAQILDAFNDLCFWGIWAGEECIENIRVDADARDCIRNATEKRLEVRIDFVVCDQTV